MSQKETVRTYGRKARKPLVEKKPLAELDINTNLSKITTTSTGKETDGPVKKLTTNLKEVTIREKKKKKEKKPLSKEKAVLPTPEPTPAPPETPKRPDQPTVRDIDVPAGDSDEEFRVLTWEDVCPVGDRIEKIAEASYAEVYRITNERGTSIIKVIRLESPIRPQTKSQQNSGLVDEEPHSENDMAGELQISELLADIPGFVIYKEKYTVQGKATPALLETHRTFHRNMKRKDPGRLQFYPSPSRYVTDTRFLVVELGDAGTALEDLGVLTTDQIWDIFFNVAVALARAENLVKFEHRDLHEGNVCVREVAPPKTKTDKSPCRFGYSGLDVTILDYGLSRAEDTTQVNPTPIAHDLEKDLSLFTSTHAKQCRVYRQMRSYLINGDRIWLPPKCHNKPYEKGVNGPVSWRQHHAYTNVLWLAYLYEYLVKNFQGGKKELSVFRRESHELWAHLNPEAPPDILSFSSAEDVVEFAVEAGWIMEEQLMGTAHDDGFSQVGEGSIIEIRASRTGEMQLRHTPKRRARPPTD
ncbi:Serine/threonine-protein kinase haspin [Cytospora mali]|uniref:non-specific serine/threonine protein kinase n=1 Tax=Cytospora mali TaxID=578113 RepID=A0A194VKZ6_CYTMA|nr:Serine/threonine-protein kinase haspin [Valsa mali]